MPAKLEKKMAEIFGKLPETNIVSKPLKIGQAPKGNLIFQPLVFEVYVSFKEGGGMISPN